MLLGLCATGITDKALKEISAVMSKHTCAHPYTYLLCGSKPAATVTLYPFQPLCLSASVCKKNMMHAGLLSLLLPLLFAVLKLPQKTETSCQ